MKEQKKKTNEELKQHTPVIEKDHPGEDYWESIAEDVAAGYETNMDPDEIHNIDEQPNDHKREDNANSL